MIEACEPPCSEFTATRNFNWLALATLVGLCLATGLLFWTLYEPSADPIVDSSADPIVDSSADPVGEPPAMKMGEKYFLEAKALLRSPDGVTPPSSPMLGLLLGEWPMTSLQKSLRHEEWEFKTMLRRKKLSGCHAETTRPTCRRASRISTRIGPGG